MDRQYDIITFDCYGTLIDWQSGIADAFVRAGREDGVVLRRDDVLRAYSVVEPVVEREHYRTYQEVLAESAGRVAHALGWSLAYERGTFLVSSLPDWKPFPDTNPALERLRDAGYRLGIISNVDDDLLAATRRHLTVPFDLVVTAQQVRSYKPSPRHFTAAREKIGAQRWLHAAESNFHDIVPANAQGIPTAWINRNGMAELPGGKATYVVKDLGELADVLAPVAAARA